MKNNTLRNKEILSIVIYKLISNNISFCFENNKLDAKNYFKLSFYNDSIEIITNNYNKDFKFLNSVSNGFILNLVDRIIFNY